MPASVTHCDFVNRLDYDTQLKKKFNIYTFRNFYNGGGVALGDINNDGLEDIFMTSNMGTNKLYVNKGNFKFEDISVKAGIEGHGWSTGVSFADVNGDGLPDIYVCKSGNETGVKNHNELYINNGDLSFSEKAKEYGLDESCGNSTEGVFFDYDKDGDLDMYLLKNFPIAIGNFNLKENKRLERDSAGGDKLFRNDLNKFTDVSASAGIYGSSIGFGMGVSVGDINQDGWMDIYVSNDFFERDYLYINNHDGTFKETLLNMIKSTPISSMGSDMADLNNDHYPEIFATDMLPEHNDRLKTKTTFEDWSNYNSNVDNGYYHQFTRNMLQLNNSDGTFSEIGRYAGVSATDWSWGSLITDLDNDGLKDIFVANGIYKDLTDQDYIRYFSNRDVIMSILTGNNVDYKKLIDAIPSVKLSNYAFKNIGNYRFKNMSSEWGLGDPGFSNGAAYGDLDNDGDLDLVINNVNLPMSIYRNETNKRLPGNHYLKVILKGKPGNTQAIGAKVTVKNKGKYIYIEQMPMRGYLSTIDPRPNLGLGPLTMVDSLIIEWPEGQTTLLTNVAADQTLTLFQKDAGSSSFQVEPAIQKTGYFEDISNENRISFMHRESAFNEFVQQPLLYQMMSTEGPRMCKGDANGDGREDIFITGAKGQPGAFLIQRQDGTFESVGEPFFEKDKISEGTDCDMFDANGDGYQDLYVASGGNEFPASSSALSDHLYFNDGTGKFTSSQQILPVGKYESSSCIRHSDFDKDGVMELFVGIRLKPFEYGVPCNGYLLENDGKGNFTDVTMKIAPQLLNIGMIHDMLWADVDGDDDPDMIIAGDWMPLKVLINDNGFFIDKTNTFLPEKTQGWWNCLATGDFNGDGAVDFIAGNHGLNSGFNASTEKPVTMYVSDFDLNGTVEQEVCTYNDDKSYPVSLRHDLLRQIPYLERKYPTYESYKDQQITDIFTPDQLKNAICLEASLLETSVFINDGKGHFSRKPLPVEVQFSPVYSVETGDFNGDRNTDILLGGNLYNVKPELGRCDASYGALLAGDGEGNFSYVPPKTSGLFLDGEIRDFLQVRTSEGIILVVARNNDSLMVFKVSGR
jgi:hypothetical protein